MAARGDRPVRGYTAKVGLRKPEPRPAYGLMQVVSETQAAAMRRHGHIPFDSGWLRDQISRAAATLDELPSEMVKTMAHRTAVRTEDDPCPSN